MATIFLSCTYSNAVMLILLFRFLGLDSHFVYANYETHLRIYYHYTGLFPKNQVFFCCGKRFHPICQKARAAFVESGQLTLTAPAAIMNS